MLSKSVSGSKCVDINPSPWWKSTDILGKYTNGPRIQFLACVTWIHTWHVWYEHPGAEATRQRSPAGRDCELLGRAFKDIRGCVAWEPGNPDHRTHSRVALENSPWKEKKTSLTDKGLGLWVSGCHQASSRSWGQLVITSVEWGRLADIRMQAGSSLTHSVWPVWHFEYFWLVANT